MSKLSVQGEHMNCELSYDPNVVCIGHIKDGKENEFEPGVYKLTVKTNIELIYPFKDTDKGVILTCHASRPSHNHHLLTTQVNLDKLKHSVKDNHLLNILIRKEAPCDIHIFLELWINSIQEPWTLEATGSFTVKDINSVDNKLIDLLELKDVTNTVQAKLKMERVSPIVPLQHTCHLDHSLSDNRDQLQLFLNDYYKPKLTKMYQKLRSDDSNHWYITARAPHETIAIATHVYMTQFMDVSKTPGATDKVWQLLFDLACMQVCGENPVLEGENWDHEITSDQRAMIFNYMFTLPFMGYIYVEDRVRRSNGKRFATDIWSFIHTRPRDPAGLAGNLTSFDCDDGALSIMEMIEAFRRSVLESHLLQEVQTTFNRVYPIAYLGILKIKVRGDQYLPHAVAILPHPKYPLLLESTCLTTGIWHFIFEISKKEYNDSQVLYEKLKELDSKVGWADLLQSPDPSWISMEDPPLYAHPIAMVSKNQHIVLDSQHVLIDDVVRLSNTIKKEEEEILEFGSHHPKEIPEWHPISWLDSSSDWKGGKNPSAYECACDFQKNQHKYCLFYYTNIHFYNQHKSTITKALEKMNARWNVLEYNGGRELHLIRICICVVSSSSS